jgi:hypothetical protein
MTVASPSITNYVIGKGNFFIKSSTDTVRRHIGNCPEFELTPELEKLEHFSSMEGVRERDKSIVIEKKATLRIVLEEWTPENQTLALLGTQTAQGSGSDVDISIFSVNAIRCELWFEANNDVGPKINYYFPAVDIIPSGSIPLISEEWMQFELTGDVQSSNSSFGTASYVADGAA